ncbi:MAG: sporulation protein [Oscillospiraceae bacterium]
MKRYVPLLLPAAIFCGMVVFSADAASGAREGIRLCAASLAPSLFPFFVLAKLLSAMGLPTLLGQSLQKPMGRLFHISGAGAQAFFLGISGGYPLGASVTAQLRRDGLISRDEAERLLAFANNSGPGFILGAAAGVFQSPAAGILLYVTHVLAAVCVGILFRPKAPPDNSRHVETPPKSLAEAFPDAVSGALTAVLNVCGYVIFFRALLGMLPAIPLPQTGAALMTGLFELGSGITALTGLSPAPDTLAAAAFLLGWGGLSVHGQTLGVVRDTDISCARHLAGRALCGVFAAVFTFLAARPFF